MRWLVLLFLALGPIACGGSLRASDADWTPEPAAKDKRLRAVEALSLAHIDPLEVYRAAPLGVRHDLMLSEGAHDARCSCLAVEVGPANDFNMFFWLGTPPDIGHEALAIAVGARGVPCPGGDPDDRRRRPSISAVDLENDDVLVEVEDLPEGRPLASGAIIPKPGPKGSVYLRPRRGNALYGHGHRAGTARCKVR